MSKADYLCCTSCDRKVYYRNEAGSPGDELPDGAMVLCPDCTVDHVARLLPPGGERREEWAVRYRVVGNDDDELRDGDLVEIPCVSREAALATFDRLAEVWAHHPRLLRRVIHTGPWTVVE